MKHLIFVITLLALVVGCAEKPKKEPITVPYSGTMPIETVNCSWATAILI